MRFTIGLDVILKKGRAADFDILSQFVIPWLWPTLFIAISVVGLWTRGSATETWNVLRPAWGTVLFHCTWMSLFLKVHFALKFYNFVSEGFLFPFRILCQLALVWKCFMRQVNLAFLPQTEDTLKSCLLIALPWEYFVSVSIYCSF